MSDILSNFYKTYYHYNKTINTNNNFLTPHNKLRVKTDNTARNLSPHGIYLSENNTLLISRKNKFKPLTLNKKIKIQNYKSIENDINNQNKNLNLEENKMTTSNYNQNILNLIAPQPEKCFSYKKRNKLLLKKNENILNKEEKLKLKQNIKANIKTLIINKNNNIKSRNVLYDFSLSKSGLNNNPTYSSNNNPTITSIFSYSQNQDNKTFYKTIKNEKKNNNNLFYKETKKEKINNKIEAEKITKELLSLKTKKDIKSYYIKKDYAKAIEEAENNEVIEKFSINNCIDPLTYIKFNLSNHPKNNDLFKSFETQIMVLGNQKYRNDLLAGVNEYKNNCVKYEDLRGPIGYDKNKINEKKRNEIIKKMKMNYIGKKGLIFSSRLFKKKFCKKNDLEFDDNFKDIKKLLYKNLNKYETNIKFNNEKKDNIEVDKNDIKTLKKIDSHAEFVIQDKDEMIKFSHRFLSFDEKINKLLLKTRNTTNYLFKRSQEHHKIKKKIDQLHEDI